MLYSESRQNRTQSHPTLTIILGFILTGLFCSCNNFAAPTEKELADLQRQQLLADSAQSAQHYLASSHQTTIHCRLTKWLTATTRMAAVGCGLAKTPPFWPRPAAWPTISKVRPRRWDSHQQPSSPRTSETM